MDIEELQKNYTRAKNNVLKKIGYNTIDINDYEDIVQNAALSLLRNNKSFELLERKTKFELLEVFRTNVYGRGKNPTPKRMVSNYQFYDENGEEKAIFESKNDNHLTEDDIEYLSKQYNLSSKEIDIVLKIEGGYSQKEIAEFHGISAAAISNKIKKIRNKIQNEVLRNKNLD